MPHGPLRLPFPEQETLPAYRDLLTVVDFLPFFCTIRPDQRPTRDR